MSNEEILKLRWKKTDKTLRDYIPKFKKIESDIVDDVIEIFDSLDITYSDLNKAISKSEKRKLDRNIEKWREKGYMKTYLSILTNKRKYTYSNLIEIMLFVMYLESSKNVESITKEIYMIVAEDIYSQAYEDYKRARPDKKPPKRISLTWEYIWGMIIVPSFNKNWTDYLELLVMTNAQEMFKQCLICLQQNKKIKAKDLKDLVHKQRNRIIDINGDKESGALVDTTRGLGNDIYTDSFDDKDLQVRFVAEMDNRTTPMCESMNNMLFYVNDYNHFYRYSAMDKKDVYYSCYGLEAGVNLPPINNHFHWCRSTITYDLQGDFIYLDDAR